MSEPAQRRTILTLPKHYVDVFGMGLPQALLLSPRCNFPASRLRPLGGWLADEFGARRIMYWMFGSMPFTKLLLSAPNGHIYIPEYIPKDVGAVSGLVGLLGALGGFLLPPPLIDCAFL